MHVTHAICATVSLASQAFLIDVPTRILKPIPALAAYQGISDHGKFKARTAVCICSARMRNRSSGYVTGGLMHYQCIMPAGYVTGLARCITSASGYVTGRPVAQPYC